MIVTEVRSDVTPRATRRLENESGRESLRQMRPCFEVLPDDRQCLVGRLHVFASKVEEFGKRGGSFTHLVRVNSRWDEDMIIPMINDLSAAHKSDYCKLHASFYVDSGEWKAAAATEADQSALDDYFCLYVSTIAELDRYRFVPASFPWRFSMLLSTDTSIQESALRDARALWDSLLKFEQARPGKLEKLCPVTKYFCFREIMLARGLVTRVSRNDC